MIEGSPYWSNIFSVAIEHDIFLRILFLPNSIKFITKSIFCNIAIWCLTYYPCKSLFSIFCIRNANENNFYKLINVDF